MKGGVARGAWRGVVRYKRIKAKLTFWCFKFLYWSLLNILPKKSRMWPNRISTKYDR